MSRYRLVIAPETAEVIRALHPDLKRSVRSALDALGDAPSIGEPLRGELESLCRFPACAALEWYSFSTAALASRYRNDAQALGTSRGPRCRLRGRTASRVRWRRSNGSESILAILDHRSRQR